MLLSSDPAALRRESLAARIAMSQDRRDEASLALCGHLAASELFQSAHTVMIFRGTRFEVCLDSLFLPENKSGKRFIFPLCLPDRQMAAYCVPRPQDPAFWREGSFHLAEPVTALAEEVAPADIDLVVCPCTVFDRKGGRLGHGAGYYDRFLPRCRNAGIIAAAFSVQEAESIPAEPHDVLMEGIVTEQGFIRP